MDPCFRRDDNYLCVSVVKFFYPYKNWSESLKILVTGAAGFIGSHLSEKLDDLGHEVQGLDNFSDYYSKDLKNLNANQLKQRGINISTLDLAKDYLDTLFNDIDFVYHFAAQPGISSQVSFDTYYRNNIQATYRLLQAAKASNRLKGFINIATSSVYGLDATGDESTEPKPTSYYGVTKLAAEQLVLASNRDEDFPACSLRLFSVYGPRERPEKLYPKLISSILEHKDLTLFEGSEKHLRSYTYIDDIINGLIAPLNNFDLCLGEIFNIGTDEAITTGDGIKIIEEIVGEKVRITKVPKRSGDQLRTHANIDKARRILEFDPKISAHEGLKSEVEWYKEQILGKINLWTD
jgi:nucleoside-diphosphate-sugar epimerase